MRAPDENNPRGYFEYEPVKSLARDASWVPEAEGKVVKVIHALLLHLPDGFEYRVILMQRKIQDVIRSQRQMLDRSSGISDERLAEVYLYQLQSVERALAVRPSFRVLPVSYEACLRGPAEVSKSIRDFLEIDLDLTRMCNAVERNA